jgi:hypothetical protein
MMTKILRYIKISITLLLLASSGNLAYSKNPTDSTLLQGNFDLLTQWNSRHPRLYTDLIEANMMTEAYRKNPHPFKQALPDQQQITGTIASLNNGSSAQNSAMVLARIAAAYRLTEDKKYLNRLIEWIPVLEDYNPPEIDNLGSNVGLTAGHILLSFAITYDILAGYADERVTRAVRSALIRQGQQTFHDMSQLRNIPYEQNHLIIPVAGLGVAALALIDEGEEYKHWGIFADNVMSRSLASIANDGWFFEGISYWDYTMQFVSAYAAAMQRLIGKNLFLTPPFQKLPEYVSHMTLPKRNFVFDFADWGPRVEPDGIHFQPGYDKPWHSTYSTIRPFFLYLTWREGGHHPLLARYLSQLMQGDRYSRMLSNIDCVFWMMLGLGNQLQTLDTTGDNRFPPYHYFDDMEVVHWRSNWHDPDATAIAFKSGPPAGHSFLSHLERHPDSKPSLGHAHPDAGSFILYSRGAFLANDTGYTGKKETADHNSLLIDGFGQSQGGTAWSTFNDRPYADYDAIRLNHVILNPKVAAAQARFDAAYPPAMKMRKVQRDWILVDGRFMVIADELISEVPRRYSWRIHMDHQPVARKDHGYTMVNGQAKLSIFPLVGAASAQVNPTVVETELFNHKRSRPQQRGYHLEVSSESAAAHRFLTALIVGSSQVSESALSATLEEDGSVTLTDEDGSCRISRPSSNGFDGSIACQTMPHQ